MGKKQKTTPNSYIHSRSHKMLCESKSCAKMFLLKSGMPLKAECDYLMPFTHTHSYIYTLVYIPKSDCGESQFSKKFSCYPQCNFASTKGLFLRVSECTKNNLKHTCRRLLTKNSNYKYLRITFSTQPFLIALTT